MQPWRDLRSPFLEEWPWFRARLWKGTSAMAFQREVFSRVCVMLAEVLNVDEGDIKPTCRLQADLGAESIDFMDIVFRLEREFDIRISRDELFPEFLLGD